jgi:hypothetical protein
MQYDTSLTAARIGKGKAVHHYYPGATRTGCAAGGMGDAPATVVDEAITCKTCLKSLAHDIEWAHGAAITEHAERETQAQIARDEADIAEAGVAVEQTWSNSANGERIEVTRVTARPFPRISYRVTAGEPHRMGCTGTLPLAWFVARYESSCEHGNGPTEACQGCGTEDADGNQVDLLPDPVQVKVGDRMLHERTATVGRVTFIGVGQQVLHVKPEGGGRAIVAVRGEFSYA